MKDSQTVLRAIFTAARGRKQLRHPVVVTATHAWLALFASLRWITRLCYGHRRVAVRRWPSGRRTTFVSPEAPGESQQAQKRREHSQGKRPERRYRGWGGTGDITLESADISRRTDDPRETHTALIVGERTKWWRGGDAAGIDRRAPGGQGLGLDGAGIGRAGCPRDGAAVVGQRRQHRVCA